MPLARLAAEKAMKSVKTTTERPVVEGAGGALVIDDDEMPFAGGECVVAMRPQDLLKHGRSPADEAAAVGVAVHEMSDARHPDAVMVAPSQQRCARRRTQGGGVEIVVTQP